MPEMRASKQLWEKTHTFGCLGDAVQSLKKVPRSYIEADLRTIGKNDDFDNAVCSYGPDENGRMFELHHHRDYRWRKLAYDCRCEVWVFEMPRSTVDLRRSTIASLYQSAAAAGENNEPNAVPPGACGESVSFGWTTDLWNEEHQVAADDFLPNWFSRMMPAIEPLTLYDLCLPGSHDTITYDLSTSISEGDTAASFRRFGGMGVGSIVKNASVCQQLTLQAQLDSGIRFFDMRIMFTNDDWYGLHAVTSNQKALHYFEVIQKWLLTHEHEIVVIFTSRHGNDETSGHEQFPDVDIVKKLEFWSSLENLFGNLLIDHHETPLKTTSISELIKRGTRVAFICSDWAQFTNRSSVALDADLDMSNFLPGSYSDPVLDTLNLFSTLHPSGENDKWMLVSLAFSMPAKAIAASVHKMGGCSAFGVPGMTR